MNNIHNNYGFSETFLFTMEDFSTGKHYKLILSELIYKGNRLDITFHGYYYLNTGDGRGYGYEYEDDDE